MPPTVPPLPPRLLVPKYSAAIAVGLGALACLLFVDVPAIPAVLALPAGVFGLGLGALKYRALREAIVACDTPQSSAELFARAVGGRGWVVFQRASVACHVLLMAGTVALLVRMKYHLPDIPFLRLMLSYYTAAMLMHAIQMGFSLPEVFAMKRMSTDAAWP